MQHPNRSHFARGTWIDPEEHAYHERDRRRARALCPDGKVRACRASYADTYFTIPARCKVKGRTVAGWLEVRTASGLSTATADDSAFLVFFPNYTGKNGAAFGTAVTDAHGRCVPTATPATPSNV